MIAHYGVRNVIALCEVEETSSGGCAAYVPHRNEEGSFLGGKLRTSLKEQSPIPGVKDGIRRVIEVHFDGDSWELTQLHHPGWDDCGAVPRSEALSLVASLSANFPQSQASAPILVHCSAGVGRTGCFIGLCCLIASIVDQRVQNDGKVPSVSVMATVLHLRKHRPLMVQTQAQYNLLYTSLREFLKQNLDEAIQGFTKLCAVRPGSFLSL
eukprot:gnl/TRDRNA2_/TRDRNA2_32732_c0_seq2.p1 gnl/TRDRNA2_/TRDRNA2_32732_c0~~gnl/TRDRNA2_/TRDRNA2_32732_c0_seq2.p1  ORF type:complete len:211 (-),score=22.36 gnl/TRDRNA2_/TRDRNA2_32732_c0_seq2:48-680(-)